MQDEKTTSGVDRDGLLRLVGGDVTLLRTIVKTFLKEYKVFLASVEKAISDSDHHTLERAAHTLAGSVSYFGTEQTAVLFQELERMGREGIMHQAEEKYALAKEALERLEPELAKVIEDIA